MQNGLMAFQVISIRENWFHMCVITLRAPSQNNLNSYVRASLYFVHFQLEWREKEQLKGKKNKSSYYGVSLLQNLVVLAERGQEDEGGDVFKAVDPLPTLWFLTADIHNPAREKERERSFKFFFLQKTWLC